MNSAVPTYEQPILQKLINLRSKLTALKQDRSDYMKSSDVSALYEQLISQISKINHIRQDPQHYEERNRLDTVLEDVFQLLSLCFLTVGLNRAAPATYASLSTVQRILEHLKEVRIYSENDLRPIRTRLEEIKTIVKNDSGEESPEVVRLLKTKIDVAESSLKELEDSLSKISPDMMSLLGRLVQLRRDMFRTTANNKAGLSIKQLNDIKEELRRIEAKRVDGHFLTADGDIAEGESQVNACIEDIHDNLNDILASKDELIAPFLQDIFNELTTMKSQLETLLLTHRWTMRETDLYNYQHKLKEIDDLRVNGKFVDENGNPGKGGNLLLYLLRRCYALIYKLLEASEPVSEALMPIQNQLSTVRRCLLEVKRMGGLSSARELYPYQMKLASIDNMRQDGKFLVGDTIPEGQGLLNALLAECFDICHELRTELDEANEGE
ncbi:hypothetical protein CANCADRAFT_107746 [Tortispora caseinolytica NRRL Y-17796]|uniref:Uncharacterized protein n=1 Tax=Tortispora caseinolytica NRRL Y-17796 TaxID=767744 RepID=A0A1E4TFL2_9ASCO|nr:hypothetical protein CANCADRAFT_107746 [Tortispora caseinolytica NRRL Y-17796]